MFSKDTYIQRRQELKKLVKSGVVLIFGNNNSPCNFPNNGITHSVRTLPSFIISDSSVTDLWVSSTLTTT